MVHLQDDSDSHSLQECCSPSSARACLLKGCDRHFQPIHHLDRYCSDACVQAAKAWSRKLANKKYRESEKGKLSRADQAKRYRERIQAEKAAEMSEPPEKPGEVVPREGYHKEQSKKKSCCHRPGCYERFDPHPRAPHQKYCGPECYKAIRRVLIREKKSRERLEHAQKKPRPKRSSDAHQERPA